MAAAAAAFPGCCGLRRLQSPRAWLQTIRCSGTFPCPSPEFPPLPPPGTGMAVEEASSDSRSDAGSRAAEVATAASVCSTKASVRSPSLFPKRGQTLELVCESLAFKGNGVCKMADTGFVVMCDRALPGERFIGRVSRKKGNYAEVKKLETLSPHWDIVDAPCKYASDCGGCKTQNLLYEAQVRSKEQQVHELLTHVGKFSNKDPEFATFLRPIIPCNVRYHYRNKMEFSFGTKKWLPTDQLSSAKVQDVDTYALGLHAPGYFDRVLHIENCLLQSEAANKVLAAVQDNWIDPTSGLSPYNVHTHTGFLKHLMLRTGRDCTTGLPELMVNFVTASYNPELLIPLVNKIVDIPEVVSIVNNVNTSVGNTSVGEEEYILYGKPTITETLRGLTFQISANSFFQTNTHQAEVLYKLIEDCAGLRGDGSEIVLDLFCGTGTIGLTLAKRARHVYGYEVVAQAISDACRNAELNDIENATFVQGDLNKINDDFGNDFPKPDVVIADPNRPGMHMKLIEFLIRLKASRIVYVSCNPSTCSRDLDYLCHGVEEKNIKGCYKLRSLQPVDMFPHTPHIECVCLLELCC
uniref:Putative RNA methyltransferase CT0009 n=1 Tax=Anthurium amnicola TaxID=1678845 RepID=A0A1D1XYH0_9ARAE